MYIRLIYENTENTILFDLLKVYFCYYWLARCLLDMHLRLVHPLLFGDKLVRGVA